jgi:phage gpG-like protein
MNIELKINPQDIQRVNAMLSRLGDGRVSTSGGISGAKGGWVKKVLRRSALDLEALYTQEVLSGQILKRRTGDLARSFQSFYGEDGGEPYYLVGSGVRDGRRMPYANIHETGGTIRPKNGKYLTIPILAGSDYAITSGLSRKRISRSSRVVGFRKVKSVTIPARRYMTIGVKLMAPKYAENVIRAIEKEIKG